jgi:hypothetical protein
VAAVQKLKAMNQIHVLVAPSKKQTQHPTCFNGFLKSVDSSNGQQKYYSTRQRIGSQWQNGQTKNDSRAYFFSLMGTSSGQK